MLYQIKFRKNWIDCTEETYKKIIAAAAHDTPTEFRFSKDNRTWEMERPALTKVEVKPEEKPLPPPPYMTADDESKLYSTGSSFAMMIIVGAIVLVVATILFLIFFE